MTDFPHRMTPPAPVTTAPCGFCHGSGKEEIASDPACECLCHLDLHHILQLRDSGELSWTMALDMIDARQQGKAYCKWCEGSEHHKCLGCDGKGEA